MAYLTNFTAAIRATFAKNFPPFHQVTSSSGWFIANNDTKTVESDVDDPVEAVNLNTKAFVIDTAGKTFLHLAHFYVGTDPADDVKVRAFGFFPMEKGQGGREPVAVSASYPASSATNVGDGFWAPLYFPSAGGVHEQTLHAGAATPDVENNGSTPNYKLKAGVRYGLEGALYAVVLVSDPSTTPTVGLVLARTGN